MLRKVKRMRRKSLLRRGRDRKRLNNAKGTTPAFPINPEKAATTEK